MYGCKLAMFLIQPQLHHLHIFSNGLQIYAQNAIAEHLGLKIERPRAPPGTKKHCQTCLEQIESVHQKKEKNYFVRTVHRCIKWSTLHKPFSKDLPYMFQAINIMLYLYLKRNWLKKKLKTKIHVIYDLLRFEYCWCHQKYVIIHPRKV